MKLYTLIKEIITFSTMRRHRDNYSDNGFDAWGGYMNAKIAKLEDQFHKTAQYGEQQTSNIFQGISVYVNGYTNPSADEIKALMSKHGGVYHTYQRTNDFVIASNLPDTKVKKLNEIVIKPEWITESIAATRLLDYRNYLLFNNNTKSQPKLGFLKLINEHSQINTNFSCNESLKSENRDLNNKTNNTCTKNEAKVEKSNVQNISYDKNKQSGPKLSASTSINKIEELYLKNDAPKVEYNIKTAVDPKFLSEFYNNSRLHHISQLGAQFKQYVNELRESSNFMFPARSQLISSNVTTSQTPENYTERNFEGEKVIMHIDMDCFFVSVGLRDRPELRGCPIAVTHARNGQIRYKRPGADLETEFMLYKERRTNALAKSMGICKEISKNADFAIQSRPDDIIVEDDKCGSLSEIASCSYEARAKGIKNGMFMGAAIRLCPNLITIPYDFEGYKEVAYKLYNTVAQYTLDIEAVSCDEMYVDCTELIKTMNIGVQELSTALRNEIKIKTGCPCSTGFGGNRLQARLATKRAKPDGQFFLTSDLVHDFMTDIKLSDLPGVGRQTSQRLEALGHYTCGSLQAMPLPTLQRLLGRKTGAHLYHYCRGRDDGPLNFHIIRKSVSAEVNYGIRFENQEQCDTFLQQLSGEVSNRMQQFKVKAKTITLKLMIRAEDAPVETAKFMGHGFCDIVNKSVTLATSTDQLEIIIKEVLTLFKKLKINPKDLRGVGIQMSKLEEVKRQEKGLLSKYVSYKPNKLKSKLNNPALIVTNENNTSSLEEAPNIKKNINEHSNVYFTPRKLEARGSPSKKSSPILGTSKSPEGKRRRGRPPKHLTFNSAKHLPSNNFMSKFLQGIHTQQIDNPLQNLDQEILLALPEDILCEVLEQYDRQGTKTNKKTTDFNINKIHSTNEVKFEENTNKTENSERSINDLTLIPWKRVRDMLRAWVNETIPHQRDAELFADYAQRMVIDRHTDKLRIMLRFLKRKIENTACKEWTLIYEYIIETVQNAMITKYGRKLLI